MTTTNPIPGDGNRRTRVAAWLITAAVAAAVAAAHWPSIRDFPETFPQYAASPEDLPDPREPNSGDVGRMPRPFIYPGHAGPVRAIALAPNGRWFLTAGADGVIREWKVGSGHSVERFTVEKRPTAIAYTPDSDWLLLWDGSERVVRMDAGAGLVVTTAVVTEFPVSTLAVCDGSRRVLTGGAGGWVRDWEISAADGRVVTSIGKYFRRRAVAPGTWQVGETDVTCLACVDSNGRFVFGLRGGELGLQDQATTHWRVEGHPGGVTSVAVSPSGSHLASIGADRTVAVWDTDSGQLVWRKPAHDGEIAGVAFLPGGTELVTAGSDAVVRVWEIRSGDVAAATRAVSAVRCFAVHKTSRFVLLGGEDGTVQLLPLPQGPMKK